ncbi:MAG: AraC family transcriptional regulator [Pirellulaceae bacterium]|nr:AraC family transcriptional regulator [Pirellulaceae bacterium]
MPRRHASRNLLDDLQLDADVRALFESAPNLHFFIKDIDGRLIFCNATHRHALFRATSPDDIYGKENRDFFPNALASAFTEDDQHVISTGQPLVDRIELNLTHTGDLAWFCTNKVPARNSRGRIVGVIGISRRLESADSRLGDFELLSPAIDFIRQHSSGQISIKRLADACGMSEVTFHRDFKRLFRITPAQFVIRLRIHEACLRLTGTSEPVGTIALDCGFSDQNYFARKFKQIMGVTPTVFRRQTRTD